MVFLTVLVRVEQIRKKAKIRNRYNQVPHLTQNTLWESDKITINVIYRSAYRSALSQQVTTRLQDTDRAICQRGTQIKKIQKESGAYLRVRKRVCVYSSALPL